MGTNPRAVETRTSAEVMTTRLADGHAKVPGDEIPAGTTLERYVVLEEVGRGGMGRVLRAYDPKLEREVALKIVRSDRLTNESLARLVREARAMAKLSHPNAVAVYDVEVSASQVVLVMEYVPGQTLRQWLKDGPRPWPQVLRRFLAAGRGLVAAHDCGLLHRDFKPANVLVLGEPLEPAARAGEVKVTDFGLAKASAASSVGLPSQDGTSEPPLASSAESLSEDLTEAGAVIGTPRYMAPEQHSLGPLTPAADQYAFCVSLWEALVGTAPFPANASARDKRAGPPPWPAEVDVPRSLQLAVRRGLEARPEDRWASMRDLLYALERELPTPRRSRVVIAVGVGLIATTATALYQWSSARAERCGGASGQLVGVWDEGRRAEVEAGMLSGDAAYASGAWRYASRYLDGYASTWTRAFTEACEASTIRGEQSAAVMDLRMACLQRAKEDLEAVATVLASGRPQVVQEAHEVVEGLRSIERCADVDALLSGVPPPAPADADVVPRVHRELSMASSLRHSGQYPEAHAALERAEALAESTSYEPLRTELMLERGELLHLLGDYDASEAALSDTVRLAIRHEQWAELQRASMGLMLVIGQLQQHPREAFQHRALLEGFVGRDGDPRLDAELHLLVAGIHRVQEDHEQAEAACRHALALLSDTVGEEHPRVAFARRVLASILHERARYDQAEQEARLALSSLQRTLGPGHPAVAATINNLAKTLKSRGRYDEAEAEFRRAIELYEAALGTEHLLVAGTRNNLAALLFERGRHAEAEEQYRESLRVKEEGLAPDHPDVLGTLNNLAMVLGAQGKHERAEVEYRRVLAIVEDVRGSDHSDVARVRQNLAISLFAQERVSEAEAEQRRALSTWQAAVGDDHPEAARARSNLGAILRVLKRIDEARDELERALASLERALGDGHPEVAVVRGNLAEVHLERQRPELALPLAERAWTGASRRQLPPSNQANIAYALARATWESGGDRSRARRLAEDAADLLDPTVDAEALAEIRSWLEARPEPRP